MVMAMDKASSNQRWFSSSFRIVVLCWFSLLVSTRIVTNCRAQSGAYSDDTNQPYLSEESVVLITGAAGFLGSELALALHRTYAPKLIICVDRMGNRPDSQEELALFEFQRQRSFNVMQTLGGHGRFYRVDFSPMIPEYFDLGEIPVLDHIFREHPDISHVVHLADPFPHSALQAVPREKDVPKAGMMEALLEQLSKHKRDFDSKSESQGMKGQYIPPNFVYASSFEVYPHFNTLVNTTIVQSANNGQSTERKRSHVVLEEKQTLTTPSSLRGASKMMDEMIAKLYYDTKDIYSIGLRFFSVYGPWGVPGSPVFELAERAVAGDLDDLDAHHQIRSFYSELTSNKWRTIEHDFVFIDDAVDAMMAAMQFRSAPLSDGTPQARGNESRRSPHPIIFNVASGEGHSLEDILHVMQEFFPPEIESDEKKNSETAATNDSDVVGSVGSIRRAESLLGYQPQVSLREGIIKTLAWHFDRAFPYGGRSSTLFDQMKTSAKSSTQGKIDFVSQHGIAGCLQYDKECLRGTPVFPCASECSHRSQCTKSYYDEVIVLTQKLTTNCKSVMYTIDLDDSLESVPSAKSKFQNTASFLAGTCNIAFVSQQSILLKKHQKSSTRNKDGLIRDGSWVLVPLKVVQSTTDEGRSETINMIRDKHDLLKLLPKLSPGLFFGSKTIERAIYVDPDIIIEDIDKLLLESYAQPYHKDMEGATAMLIGRGTPTGFFSEDGENEEEIILKLDDPKYQPQVAVSTNTLVQNSAYRMVKIAVSDSLFGDGFMDLLDSRWIVHGLQSDDGRLFRCDVLGELIQWEVTSDRSALEFVLGLHDMWSRVIAKSSGVNPWWIGDSVITVPEGEQRQGASRRRRLLEDDQGEVNVPVDGMEEMEAQDDVESSKSENFEENINLEKTKTIREETVANDAVLGQFVADAVAQKEVPSDNEKANDIFDEHTQGADDHNTKTTPDDELQKRNFSSYDTWMGILSSSTVKYFVRIVPSSEVGVASIDHE